MRDVQAANASDGPSSPQPSDGPSESTPHLYPTLPAAPCQDDYIPGLESGSECSDFGRIRERRILGCQYLSRKATFVAQVVPGPESPPDAVHLRRPYVDTRLYRGRVTGPTPTKNPTSGLSSAIDFGLAAPQHPAADQCQAPPALSKMLAMSVDKGPMPRCPAPHAGAATATALSPSGKQGQLLSSKAATKAREVGSRVWESGLPPADA
jgi:hypothetical protein